MNTTQVFSETLQLEIRLLVHYAPYSTQIGDANSSGVGDPIWLPNSEVACPVHGAPRTKEV